MPALLTRMSSRPNSFSIHSAARSNGSAIGYIQLHETRIGAFRL